VGNFSEQPWGDSASGVTVVRAVVDCAPHPPSRWELIVVVEDAWGNPDAFIVEPWDCRPDTAAAQELADRGIV
jgi:hypothetical protein